MKFRVQALAADANQQPKGWTLNFRPQTAGPELLDTALITGGKCGYPMVPVSLLAEPVRLLGVKARQPCNSRRG